MPDIDGLCEPALSVLRRSDLELPLAVTDGAALIVLAPGSGMTRCGVRAVARAHHVAVHRPRAMGVEHGRLDVQGCLEGPAGTLGQSSRVPEAGCGHVQTPTHGHDDGHDQALDRLAHGEGMPETLHPIVAADDHADGDGSGALERFHEPSLHVEVPLARHPRRNRSLERAGRIETEARQSLPLALE